MTRTRRCVVSLLLASSVVVRPQGQTPASTDQLVALMGEAQKAYARSAWDEATEKFQRIIDLARERHDDLWEARGISGLGAVAHVRGRDDEAHRLFSTSLDTFDRLDAVTDAARVERNLGDIAFVRHDLKGARAWYEKAAQSAARGGDESGRIRAARLIIRVDDDEGATRPLDAIAQLAQDARAIGDRALEAPILHDWADMLFNRGQYEAAIEKLDACAALYESLGQLDDLATVYNSLGRIFRVHGQPNAALQAQLKALEISERSGVQYARVQSLNAVAVAYNNVGDRAKARDYFERALALAEEVKLAVALPMLRANVGSFLVQTGDVARGRTMIQTAMQEEIGATRSLRYTQLAEADMRLGELAAARADVGRALDTCEAADSHSCVLAHLASAAVHLANGDDVAVALADQRAAVDELERLQTTLAASDFLKQGFSAWWARTYSLAIDLEARQGDWRAALETAELARARAFVDLMASRAAESRPAPEGRVDLTWRGLSAAAPIDMRSDATAAPSTLANLAAVAARQHTALLQFWLAEQSLYAWVIDEHGTVHGARTDVPSVRIEQLVRAVGSGTSTAAMKREAWAALYDTLVKPVERYLPSAPGARLTIVPHGPLMQLPFAALCDPRGRYLVERFTLSSVPSVAMLRYRGAERTDARRGAMLLVADPAATPKIAGEPRLPRLPGALEEARAIARLMPASRTTLLADANATEARVLAAGPQKSVIHFATHAIVRDGDPWSSFLALGVAGEGAADGKLTAQKIYGLSLDADLVVLSACRSGGGLITGDGIASLARAFFYAGASSMIVSVWDVADEPAKRLLPAFYRSWFAGADKATALRAAQLALIRDLRAGRVMVATPAGDVALVENPALWAGFVLLGDPG